MKVELLQLAISEARECKFAVHLIEKVPEEQFKCKKCGMAFGTANELEGHEGFPNVAPHSLTFRIRFTLI